jgi:Heparinase II/III-like protein.
LIDAGPHGVGNGGHGHADALSVRLSLNRRPWLVDAGTHVYISPRTGPKNQIKNQTEGLERNRFRGTAAHNTLRVDGLDQAIPKGPFAWNSLPDVRAEHWITGSGFTLFSGNHDGYAKLPDPVIHRRTIFHLHGEYFLVRDVAEGQGVHDLDIFWHFAPALNLRASGTTLVAELEGETSDEHQLTLLTASSAKWDVSAEDGLVSSAYGAVQSAPVGLFKVKTSVPAEIAALLIPSRTKVGVRDGNFRLASPQASDPAAYIYERGEFTDYAIFGRPGGNWIFRQFGSDASLLFVRTQGAEIISLIFCSATFVEIDGKRVFSSPELVSKFEWTRAVGVAASNPTSPKFFDEESLRPRTAVP